MSSFSLLDIIDKVNTMRDVIARFRVCRIGNNHLQLLETDRTLASIWIAKSVLASCSRTQLSSASVKQIRSKSNSQIQQKCPYLVPKASWSSPLET